MNQVQYIYTIFWRFVLGLIYSDCNFVFAITNNDDAGQIISITLLIVPGFYQFTRCLNS